jgi:hypothetical protein
MAEAWKINKTALAKGWVAKTVMGLRCEHRNRQVGGDDGCSAPSEARDAQVLYQAHHALLGLFVLPSGYDQSRRRINMT